MKYLFELILEDELYEIKRENRVKESLIQIANDEITNLAKENKIKNSAIQKCNEEILKEIKINSDLLKEKRALTLELDSTQDALKKEHDRCKYLEEANKLLQNKLSSTEATLAEEVKQKEELVKVNKKLESTFKHLTEQAEKFEALNKELNKTLKEKDHEISLYKAELKVQKDHVEDIQMKMKYLKDDMAIMEDKYLSEKQYKTKLEKLKETLTNNIEELYHKIEDTEKQVKHSNELKKSAEIELSNLRIDFDEEKREHEISISSLKKRHNETVEEMSRQIQQLFVSKTKLEKERMEQSKAYEAPIKELIEPSKSLESPLTVDEKIAYESKRLSALRSRFRNPSKTVGYGS